MPGIGEIVVIALLAAVLLGFGSRRLPDAARQLGRSLRVFRAETRGLREDDVRGRAEAPSVRGPLGNAGQQPATGTGPAGKGAERPAGQSG